MTEQSWYLDRNATLASGGIRAPKSAEIIAARLRGLIVRGELREGDNLPTETALIEQFGVSRPTLREAFRLLESESLLLIRRGSRGGAKVTRPDLGVTARNLGLLLQLSETTIADVYQARVIIEPSMVRLLASKATEQDIADLRRLISELSTLVESGQALRHDVDVWSRAAYDFHRMVLDRADNHTLAIQAGMLEEVIRMHLIAAVSRNTDTAITRKAFRRSIRSYSKLVDFFEEGDIDGAGEHWETHMTIAGELLLRGIESTAVVDLFN